MDIKLFSKIDEAPVGMCEKSYTKQSIERVDTYKGRLKRSWTHLITPSWNSVEV